MKNSKSTVPEGTWFAVPLRDGGFCRGLMARTNGKGFSFGYFFGPKKATIDELPDVSGLQPNDAVLIGRFGDLGLLNGEWKVIHNDTHWDRTAWPMPAFVRLDKNACTAMQTKFNDNFEIIFNEPCDPSLANVLPEDSSMGYGYVEISLTELLRSVSND